jgi:hypothetical protein
LIREGGEVHDLISAVKYMTPEISLSMRKNSEKQAEKFSLDEFEKQIKKYIYK